MFRLIFFIMTFIFCSSAVAVNINKDHLHKPDKYEECQQELQECLAECALNIDGEFEEDDCFEECEEQYKCDQLEG